MSQATQTLTRSFVTGPGPEIAVAECGDGPAMILLHGIGSTGTSWMPIISALSARYRIYLVDQRGHGRSGHPKSGYQLEDYAGDLERVLDYVGADPIIVGHSLGGLVATTWAKRHPDQARAIALEDMPPTIGAERASMLEQWAELAAMPIPDIIEHYRLKFPDWTDADRKRRAEMITSTQNAVFTEMRDRKLSGKSVDALEGLEIITSPITLIYGDVEAGSLIPEATAARFRSLGPNFSATRILGASHTIHRDSTAPFLNAMFKFLDRV